jgi:hypothetical protein
VLLDGAGAAGVGADVEQHGNSSDGNLIVGGGSLAGIGPGREAYPRRVVAPVTLAGSSIPVAFCAGVQPIPFYGGK